MKRNFTKFRNQQNCICCLGIHTYKSRQLQTKFMISGNFCEEETAGLNWGAHTENSNSIGSITFIHPLKDTWAVFSFVLL